MNHLKNLIKNNELNIINNNNDKYFGEWSILDIFLFTHNNTDNNDNKNNEKISENYDKHDFVNFLLQNGAKPFSNRMFDFLKDNYYNYLQKFRIILNFIIVIFSLFLLGF